MKTLLRLGAFLVVLTAGCGDPVTPLAIIVLTNTWQELGNAEHTFGILDDTDGTAASAGTFTGTETLPDGVTTYAIEGYWRSSTVTMTVNRSPAVTYRARIPEDDADRLDFTSSAGSLILVRNVDN